MKTETQRKAFWKKVKAERCYCGHLNAEHTGNARECNAADCNCEQYTWKEFLDAKGKVIK